jgi:hypothetical protein
MNFGQKISLLAAASLLTVSSAVAQISPGDLAKPHEFLEGIPNCTKCHVLGSKINGDKCLDCHTEIRERLSEGKGYHSSAEVKGKQCIECHSDHHGKNFDMIHFNPADFDHRLAGFELSKPHAELKCGDCHNAKFIKSEKARAKKYTYLGLNASCLTCHADYHLGTLSSSCLNCHGPETFKTAPAFSHDKARFRLLGKHRSVECVKCHKFETINGSKFQEFRGVAFASCINCHTDPHQGKFGQDCRRCHNEESFQVVKGMNNFDHNKTNYPLVDKHLSVDCRACHKTKFTDPVKHDRCTDCHEDYHKGQFSKNGVSPDCSDCHNIKGFTLFSYTIERHNMGTFPLKGAHVAEPCSDCHKQQGSWQFRNIGTKCVDCHPDIHKSFIDEKFYPGSKCLTCHNESDWHIIAYDHSVTSFQLTGAHMKQPCTTCHMKPGPSGARLQKFAGMSGDCYTCHNDVHHGQFDLNGSTDCAACHGTDRWTPAKFDHNKTAFRLDGKHVNVPCAGCHKPQREGNATFTVYKIKDFRCESCHF